MVYNASIVQPQRCDKARTLAIAIKYLGWEKHNLHETNKVFHIVSRDVSYKPSIVQVTQQWNTKKGFYLLSEGVLIWFGHNCY